MALSRRLLARVLPALLALVLGTALSGCGVGGIVDLGTQDSGPTTGGLPGSGSGQAMSASELAYGQEVLRLVNDERIRAQAPPLQWDDSAAAVAYAHSVDMDVRDFFDHTNPSGQGPGARLAVAGVDASGGWGENIATGQPTPADVMQDWMNSQGHRDNILNPGFTHLGVGVHAPGGIWWTQVFLAR